MINFCSLSNWAAGRVRANLARAKTYASQTGAEAAEAATKIARRAPPSQEALDRRVPDASGRQAPLGALAALAGAAIAAAAASWLAG